MKYALLQHFRFCIQNFRFCFRQHFTFCIGQHFRFCIRQHFRFCIRQHFRFCIVNISDFVLVNISDFVLVKFSDFVFANISDFVFVNISDFVLVKISDFVLIGHKRVSREIIIMSDLNKVVLCHEKIESKNLRQNSSNFKHFLLKDFNCDCEDVIKLTDRALAANVIKSAIFNGKVSYRTVRADPVGDDTVLVPETQEIDSKNEHVSTVFFEESLTSLVRKFDSSRTAKERR